MKKMLRMKKKEEKKPIFDHRYGLEWQILPSSENSPKNTENSISICESEIISKPSSFPSSRCKMNKNNFKNFLCSIFKEENFSQDFQFHIWELFTRYLCCFIENPEKKNNVSKSTN